MKKALRPHIKILAFERLVTQSHSALPGIFVKRKTVVLVKVGAYPPNNLKEAVITQPQDRGRPGDLGAAAGSDGACGVSPGPAGRACAVRQIRQIGRGRKICL